MIRSILLILVGAIMYFAVSSFVSFVNHAKTNANKYARSICAADGPIISLKNRGDVETYLEACPRQ